MVASDVPNSDRAIFCRHLLFSLFYFLLHFFEGLGVLQGFLEFLFFVVWNMQCDIYRGGVTLIEWGSIDPHFFSKIYVIYLILLII
jgi:hypothetical protein